ncbi:MAG TPA: hypothetical protein VFX57_05315 [Sulfuricurvum sp.]|nr:hypothetical protein [Sulfuricurvum sp.]
MKKILAFALALSATALLACPMGQCMMSGPMCQGMGQKCQCDTSKLPPRLEALGLSDQQKAQVQKIREEGKAFHNQQHEKMMGVLTAEQRTKFDMSVPAACPKKGMQMPMGGMGCKICPTK